MTVLMDPAPPIVGDIFRIVTFTTGGRPTTVLDLNDGTGYYRDRTAGITYTPGAPTVQYSRPSTRFGGAQAVGESHDNGGIAWTAYIRGVSDTDARDRIETLLSQIEEAAPGRYIQWGPVGGTSSYLRIGGPGTWAPNYQVREFGEQHAMGVTVSFPVLPLVEWDRMTIRDDYVIDSSADYTYDALAATNAPIVGGVMTASGSLTSERRARHTARGYQTLGGQATRKYTPAATITSFKGGITLRASAANTYVEVYVDDNGTNSRLRIDVVIAGTRTNRSSTNLAARISNGTAFWVRGRVEGNDVYAEYFTAAPSPMGTPTLAPVKYTLTGGEQTSLVAGYSGWSWIPQHASATTDEFAFEPYVLRNQTLPDVFPLADEFPGTAPALVDVSVSPTGGAATPIWAQIGWAPAMGDVGGAWTGTSMSSLYGIVEAEHALALGGLWATSAQAGARGGTDVRASGAGINTYTADFPYLLTGATGRDYVPPDDFSDAATVEVWARVLVSATLAGARMTASLRRGTGGTAGETFTQEFGPTGRALTLPSVGTHYRKTRLGTLMLNSDLSAFMIRITATTTSASAAVPFGLDYIWLVPARSRALGPTGLANDSTYPAFVPDTSAWIKTVRSDLSGRLDDTGGTAAGFQSIHHGLNGSLLELDPGAQSLLVALGSQVPDDPTATSNDDQLAHSATVSLDVVPRSFLLRSQ